MTPRNDPLASINTRKTPQSEQARSDQVKNSAGGYTFQVTGEDRLRRFLVLGTEGGTYYSSEKALTKDNAKVILDWAANDPRKLADIATEISVAGRAPKQNPAIFALAAASRLAPKAEDRTYALSKVGQVCRTGTTLFLFAQYCEQFGGWGPALRKAVGRWYTEKRVDQVAFQAVKYRQRNGWTHRDLLRLSHPKVEVPSAEVVASVRKNPVLSNDYADQLQTQRDTGLARKRLFDFISGREASDLPAIVEDYLALQKATTGKQAAEIIARGNGATWELVPTQLLNDTVVWNALIDQGIPMGALIRQLPRLTNLGLARDRRADVLRLLTDQDAITRARIHPVNVLVAAKTYASGHSGKGETAWTPDKKIVDGLDGAFYLAYGNVEPTGKRTLYALDVSGSMSQSAGGLPISCHEAEAALALVTVATDTDVDVVGFTSGGANSWGAPRSRRSYYDQGISELDISPRRRLDDVVRYISRLPFGGTDCSLPMLWAQAQKRTYDTIVVCTDNETWAGGVHPHQALEAYRQFTGVRTKMVVAAFTATNFTIADPKDPDSLDIAGLDSAVPNLISDFSRGL